MRKGNNIQPPLGTPLNMGHPLCNRLLGCWLLNEGGGNIAFNSTGYRIMNGILSGAIWVVKNNFTTVSFSTFTDKITCGSSLPTQISTPLSISVWFNTIASSGYIMSHANFQTDLYGFEFFFSAGKLFFYIDGSAGTSTLSTTATYNDSKWHHAVAVADGTNQFIYVDGVQVANGAQTQTPSYTTLYNLYIGNCWDSNVSNATHTFGGQLTNVMLWTRAISHAEVRQLFTNPYQMFQQARSLKIAV